MKNDNEIIKSLIKHQIGIQQTCYLEVLSHTMGNFMLEPYEAKELIDTFGIDMESLKKELFEVYDSEDMQEWFEALQDEFGDNDASHYL